MNLRDLIVTLKEYAILIICVIVVLTPSIWALTSLFYRERIEVLKEQVNVLREQNKFLEAALKSPPQFPVIRVPISDPEKKIEVHGETKAHYPPISNPKKLSKDEVRDLAKFYRLFEDWKINPHLRFKEGDISYWYEQGLSEDALKREFDSRRIILERSETTGQVIDTQGDLSHKAEILQAR